MSTLHLEAELPPRRRWTVWAQTLAVSVVVLSVLITAIWLRALKSSGSGPILTRSVIASRGSPWIYGRSDARFTIIEYADLECPYCRAYFPVLRRWIDAHPQANWEWRHLPLAMHEPAAMQEARWVECMGETEGNAAFWSAAAWLYGHTRGAGAGLPAGVRLPTETPAVRTCVASAHPDSAIRAQAEAAAAEGIAATPTLRILDRSSGKSMLLRGPVEGDALLSALDLLAVNENKAAPRP